MLQSSTARALVVVLIAGWLWAKGIGLTPFVDPTFIDWMMDGDWMEGLYGFLFVRTAPWSLPLAQAPDLIAPTGTSAAMTDSIPLLSVLGKLSSPFFGDRFQLFGLWMVGGVIGTGVAAVLVCRAWIKDTPSLALAGCLFAVDSVVTTRYGHQAFFGLWMLVGLIGLNVWPVVELKGARRVAGLTLLLGVLACATNAYLAVMACALVGASMVRMALVRRMFARPEGAAWLISAPLLCLATLWTFGFVAGAQGGLSTLAGDGFGDFSADLLTFFNPMGWSRIFGALPMGPRQYEGLAYLGPGVLMLLVIAAVRLVKVRPSRQQLIDWSPLLVVTFLMALYALSSRITFAGQTVVDLTGLYAKIGAWTSIFRSSGRFIWSMYFGLFFVAVLSLVTVSRPLLRQLALGAALLFQVVDLDPTTSSLHRVWPEFKPFADPTWALMKDGYRHVVVHPIQIQWKCPFDPTLMAKLTWEAYRQHLSINSGHVGRTPPGIDCTRHVRPDEINTDTVYLPYFREYWPDFQLPNVACAVVEGYVVCVSKDKDTPLLRELIRRSQAGPQ